MLYRFRSAARLLEDEELENNYFYFASPSQQNDPMEGYVEYFWKGDWIAWLGLFKHYAWQVFMTLFMIPLQPDIEDLYKLHLYRTEIHQKDTKLPEIRLWIEEKVASDDKLCALSTELANSYRKMSATELQMILIVVHRVALYYANQALEENGIELFTKSEATDKLFSLDLTYQGIEAFITILKSSEPLMPLCKAVNNALSSLILLSDMTIAADGNLPIHKAWSFLIADFPENYVRQITRLSFADWYCVCFNTNATNPSLWGYYADGHKGICLIFKNNPANGIYLEEMNPAKKAVPKKFQIHKVSYGEECVEVDFFRSLGNLWGDERSHWLINNGAKSQILTEIFEDVDRWREEYHTLNTCRLLRKSVAWKAEEEYRIVLDDSWENHRESRKFLYRFEDLDGIVFGIKTPTEHKLKIIDVIRRKCAEVGRESFNFYQAAYDAQSSQIELDAIPWLSNTSTKIP